MATRCYQIQFSLIPRFSLSFTLIKIEKVLFNRSLVGDVNSWQVEEKWPCQIDSSTVGFQSYFTTMSPTSQT